MEGRTPPAEDERILVLARGCEQILDGRIDPAAFSAWLRAFEQEQKRRADAIMAIFSTIPIGMEDDFLQEMEIGMDGVRACEAAITWLQSEKPITRDDILETLRAFHDGTASIKRAIEINRRARGDDDEGGAPHNAPRVPPPTPRGGLEGNREP